MSEQKNIKLYLMGTGIYFPHHLTIESLGILENATVICTNLPEEQFSLLGKEVKAKIKSFASSYIDGRIRMDNYNDVTKLVINEVQTGKQVVWLTPGHPTIFDRVTSNLINECKKEGHDFMIIPGISSIDTILCDTGYEAAYGLFVYETSALVKNKIHLNPSVSSLLLQPHVFMSEKAHIAIENVRPDFTLLEEYLGEYYSQEHKCAFIRSYANLDATPSIFWTVISRLTSAPITSVAGSTLWIPKL